ncbi:PBECR2 nuclease fold domain-containing protein, partial [Campylobacter upsaliensis]
LDKDLNKSYTLELENLEPVSLNANALSKETEALTQSVESGHKQSTTIAKTDEESIAENAKNDEVLEAEVIEEVGLNEPMKFLEFQQRKLLTYIKENTPLRLLEHKKELKTRDILNFLEQSALNGKQKVFLMRNLERDLGKIELKIKENESVKAKIKNTYEISQSEAKELGEHFNFKGKKPLLRELRENEIKHALKSHGNKESEEARGNYNKEVLLKNAKTSPYPQNADEAVRLETISKQELEQSNPQQSHLSTDESIAQNSQEAKIKEAVKNHNAIYKEILDNDYIFTDERSKIFRKRERELIENLAKDEKVQAFTSQWGYPFKKDGELRGIGLNYKAKVYGKGEHKMMYVDGGGFGSKTFQKKKERLLELEKERLQEAFKADFGIDGFISKYVENVFFRTLWEETKAYKGIDYGWGVHPREYYPYYENRIMPSDTITQAKEKLQKEKSNWSVKRQEAKGSEDIIFTDKKGKEHTLTKETQKAWLEAFNLKSLEDSYIPNHNEAIKQALEGKEIKLQLGSLKKLVAQGREKYIPQIKEVLDRPEAIMRDDMGEYLFIKHLKDDDYFVNVSFDNGEYLVSISNGIKETRNLNNKLKKGGEFIYQSPNFNFISQKLLQTSQYSANKIDEDIIAQNAK